MTPLLLAPPPQQERTLLAYQPINPEDHLGLAAAFVLRHCRIGRKPLKETEEFSDACLGLIHAVNTFKPEEGPFAAWASRCISQAVFKGFNKRQREANFTTVDKEYLDQFKGPEPVEEIVELLKGFLSEREDEQPFEKLDRQILLDWGEGFSFRQLAEKYEVNHTRIQQRVKRAIRRIRSKHKIKVEE
jgi:RNA polymerase sigma factor (sigma-70 family)